MDLAKGNGCTSLFLAVEWPKLNKQMLGVEQHELVNTIHHPFPVFPLNHIHRPRQDTVKMFSRAVRRQIVAPLRRNAFQQMPIVAARRAVTTDAASSHADKEAVPEVRNESGYFQWHDANSWKRRRMTSTSRFDCPMRASKHMR